MSAPANQKFPPDRVTSKRCGYAPVNGLQMYYEIEGTGEPLVYIPPAFGFAGLHSFPSLRQNHSVITMDLQGNGRTRDIPHRPLSINQYAEDVVALMTYLGIPQADIFGDSYGADTALLIAISHPDRVKSVVACAATFGPPESALNPRTTHFSHPPSAESADIEFQRRNYQAIAPDPGYWPTIYGKVTSITWRGLDTEQYAMLKASLLIIVGDRDFVRVEDALQAANRLPNAQLAVVPDAGHFVLYSEPERVMPIIKHFLEQPKAPIPVATADSGYRPGQNR